MAGLTWTVTHVDATLPATVRTATADTLRRRCVWVRVEDRTGLHGWGECDPDGRHLRGAANAAVADLEARRAGVPLCAHLGGPASGTLAVNAVLGVDAGPGRAAAATRSGFTTLKVKVGAASIDADMARIRAIRNAVGAGIGIRIDANGAWSADAAVRALRGLAPVGIEFVEQPVAPDDLAGAARVQRDGAVAVVADEAVTSPAAVDRIAAAGAAAGVMVKVARVGGPHAALDAARRARAAGLSVYVASLWESAVGHAVGVHTAAAIGPDGPAGFADVAAVAGVPALAVSHGRVRYGSGPGTGVTPNGC